MNVKELKESDRIIFECISGSHSYGTNVETSDVDLRGFFVLPDEEYLSLIDPPAQIGDDKHDITYYSLKRGFELLQTANPNMIELLWMPEDCVKIMTPTMEKLIENRDLFISKKCFHTHSGYAHAQIQKARGQNKKVHNPMPKEQPKKEDFCWVIDTWAGVITAQMKGMVEGSINIDKSVFPSRPKELRNTSIDLSHYHVASLEHAVNVYRLYYYGKGAKGVFRGNDMLVPESIPVEDEFHKFMGLLIYNKDAYEKAIKDHKSYWEWKKNSNKARWIDQESGKIDYDAKNLMHCMRLMMSGENILKEGFPLVRFEGSDRDYLMSIRSGKLKYEDIMSEVEKRMSRLEDLNKTSDAIPHSVNVKKIGRLYMELRGL